MTVVYESSNELYHYGVLGMKWGVRKAIKKQNSNKKLESKALRYDAKAAGLTRRSEKYHQKYDLKSANKSAVRAAKYRRKAAKIERKALNETSEYKVAKLNKRASKLKYRASKNQITANRLSKSVGYGKKAMKYSVKSDKVAKKAAKVRMQIAKNKAYEATMNKKISQLSPEELNGAYSFVNKLLEN